MKSTFDRLMNGLDEVEAFLAESGRASISMCRTRLT